MDRNINEVEFAIFDTETTGLEAESGDRIVEIAAIRLKGKEKIAEFRSLVNPHRPISEAAFQVNRISQEMLKDAPDMSEVMPEFLKFIQGTCLISYNAAFDLAFLNNELKLLGKSLPQETLVADILKMCRRLLPGLERYALCFVAERLGIKVKQEHRALSDVMLTVEVFDRLRGILEAKGIFEFTNFLSLFGQSPNIPEDIHNQKIAKIQQAMDLGVKLKIKYLSSSSASVTEREVIPRKITQENNRTYLVAYCYLRNEERSFRIDGILHLEIV